MPQPISTAPKDGRKVTVQWRDRDGVENTSLAAYRPASRTTDAGEEGWWTAIDSTTQKRIEPHSWSGPDDDSDS